MPRAPLDVSEGARTRPCTADEEGRDGVAAKRTRGASAAAALNVTPIHIFHRDEGNAGALVISLHLHLS